MARPSASGTFLPALHRAICTDSTCSAYVDAGDLGQDPANLLKSQSNKQPAVNGHVKDAQAAAKASKEVGAHVNGVNGITNGVNGTNGFKANGLTNGVH